jgi:D-alanine-D-alanine ligase
MKVGITYDLEDDYIKAGFSAEEAAEFDSLETIDAIDDALCDLGIATQRIGNIQQLFTRLGAGERWDLVFNIAEGAYGIGREAQVPALLDAYRIPYTFSDSVVLGLTLHKGLTQRIVRGLGLPTPDFAVIESTAEVKKLALAYPLFAKPVAEGTGKGVAANSRADNSRELMATCRFLLKRFRQPVLVETFLPGREFTVGIIGTGRDAFAVGVMEVTLNECAEKDAYGYTNKKNWRENVEYSLLRGSLARECSALALAAWRGLGCRDGGRIDLRLDAEGCPRFLEVNPLAGMRPKYSDFCLLNDLVGLDYQKFIGMIVDSAARRYGISLPFEIEDLNAKQKLA